MKIGARILKSGLVITLSIVLARLVLPNDVTSGSLAGIAGIIATEMTVKDTLETFVDRVISAAIGGLTAVLLIHLFGNGPIMIGLGAIILIPLLNYFNLAPVSRLSVITLIVIMAKQTDNYVLASVYRVVETLIGVAVSVVVNSLILPPTYDRSFLQTVDEVTSESLLFIRTALRQNMDHSSLKKDLQWAYKQLESANRYFSLIRSEYVWPKSKRISKQRRLLVYRQMMVTARATVNMLQKLYDNEAAYRNLADDVRVMIRERLETLMTGHEQIILKFSGRVPINEVNYIELNKKDLYNYFNTILKEINDKDEVSKNAKKIIYIMSSMLYYEEEIIRLNRVITQYRKRTDDKEEETIDILEHQ